MPHGQMIGTRRGFKDNFPDYASCITPLVVSSAYSLFGNFPDFLYVGVEPTVMYNGALPVGCGS